MKTILVRLAGAFALSLLLIATPVLAIPLNTLSTSYVGSITPDVPSNPANEESYIDFLTSLDLGATDSFDGQTMVRSGMAFGVLPPAEFSWKVDSDNTDYSLIGFTGYVLGKYDADNAGAWVWYLDAFTGDISLPATFNTHDLSHASFFGVSTSVPDGGTTAILLGLALISLAAAGRRSRCVQT